MQGYLREPLQPLSPTALLVRYLGLTISSRVLITSVANIIVGVQMLAEDRVSHHIILHNPAMRPMLTKASWSVLAFTGDQLSFSDAPPTLLFIFTDTLKAPRALSPDHCHCG